jgi:hypothetical protein
LPLGVAKDGHFSFFQRPCKIGLSEIEEIFPCSHRIRSISKARCKMGIGLHLFSRKVETLIFWEQTEVRNSESDHGVLPKNKNFNFHGKQRMANPHFAISP